MPLGARVRLGQDGVVTFPGLGRAVHVLDIARTMGRGICTCTASLEEGGLRALGSCGSFEPNADKVWICHDRPRSVMVWSGMM